jgi:hypothetical protein
MDSRRAPARRKNPDVYVGRGGRRLSSPLSRKRLERVLGHLLDESEFLSPYGTRSISRFHRDHPFAICTAAGSSTCDGTRTASSAACPRGT